MLQKQGYVFEVFASAGSASLLEFRRQFQLLHEQAPLRAIKLFLFYVGSRGVDPLAHAMAFWATSGSAYISVLVDTNPDFVQAPAPGIADQAAKLLNQLDDQFLFKLARGMAALTDPDAILRSLRLVPALEDYSILIPWLRNLVHHHDFRVCSRAAKLLCQLRPNPGLIDRHLQSPDSRVRASVLEALWQPKVIRLGQDVLPIFRSALADSNHRVVANALVGLYRLGETDSLYKMIALCSDKKHLFRAATAWAMGEVEDIRAVPSLKGLIRDRSFTVRRRASSSLQAISLLNTDEYGSSGGTLEIVPA